MKRLHLSLLPSVAALASFAVLPIVARNASIAEWAALAVGQALGLVASAVVSLGWTLSGPLVISIADSPQRHTLLADSGGERRLAFAATLLPWCGASWLVAPDGARILTVAACLAGASFGLSPAWYSIGLAQPRLLLIYDVTPRVLATVAAGVSIHFGGPIALFPLFLLTAAIASSLRHEHQINGALATSFSLRVARRAWRRGASGIAEVSGTLVASGSSLLVGVAAAPAQVATYSAAERLYRIGIMAASGLSAASMSSLARSHRRTIRASAAMIALGIIGALSLTLAGPAVAAILFGDRLAPDRTTTMGIGLSFLVICGLTVTGRYLLARSSAIRWIAIGNVTSLLAGVPLITIAASRGGADAAAWAVLCAHLLNLSIQIVPALRLLRDSRCDC